MDTALGFFWAIITAIAGRLWEAIVDTVLFFAGMEFAGWVFFLAFIIPTFVGMEVKKSVNRYIEEE